MRSADDLRSILRRIDGRGYKAYKDIAGSYQCDGWSLHIDYVQGDPFASPSKIRVRVEQSLAKIPQELFSNRSRKIALEDFIARAVAMRIKADTKGHRGSGKSGAVRIDSGAQEVLERSAVRVNDAWIEARLSVGLPAAGRRVLAREAEAMLIGELSAVVEGALFWSSFAQDDAHAFVSCVENQEAIRAQLSSKGLIAFVANGAILPRDSGVSDRPLKESEAVPFASPKELELSFKVPNQLPASYGGGLEILGMGIPEGINLIVGGGYHGKSTLLRAIERSVYPHIPGDGREYVVSKEDVVKIRAEDGRRVAQVDISPFITDLPRAQSTKRFSTEDASGSTSQAANIVEALEVSASTILIDEDTSATNFMIRDARMQSLVHKEFEPITPFLDRVEELYQSFGVSTIIVVGGCGDYFDVATTVIMMKEFLPEVVTDEAKKIAGELSTNRQCESVPLVDTGSARVPKAESLNASRGRREVKIDAKAVDLIVYGTEAVDLRAVEQLVDLSQTRAVGYALFLAKEHFVDGKKTLSEVIDAVEEYIEEHGVDSLDPFRRGESHPGQFAKPRKFEVAAAMNRLRSLQVKQVERVRET